MGPGPLASLLHNFFSGEAPNPSKAAMKIKIMMLLLENDQTNLNTLTAQGLQLDALQTSVGDIAHALSPAWSVDGAGTVQGGEDGSHAALRNILHTQEATATGVCEMAQAFKDLEKKFTDMAARIKVLEDASVGPRRSAAGTARAAGPSTSTGSGA